jgi:hypothetical protein
MVRKRILRAALLATFLGVTAVNGWIYYQHQVHDVQAMQIINVQLQAPQNRDSAARLRGSIVVLERIDARLRLQMIVLEVFLAIVIAVIWYRSA